MVGVRCIAVGTALALLALPSLSLADHHEAGEEVSAQDCGKVGEHPCGAAAACDCAKAGHDCTKGAEHKCGDAATCACGKHAEHDCAMHGEHDCSKHAEHGCAKHAGQGCGKATDQQCGKAVEKPGAPWGEGS